VIVEGCRCGGYKRDGWYTIRLEAQLRQQAACAIGGQSGLREQQRV
jgi:hypothetical protein